MGVWRLGVPSQQTRSSKYISPQVHLAPVFLTLQCACDPLGSWSSVHPGSGIWECGGKSVEKILGLVGKGAVIN